MVVEMRGVTKRYGQVLALDGIDLEIVGGDVVAILGPNGAGKTTAIDVMMGLRRPTGGSVRLFGEAPTRRAVRSRVGAMLQDSGVPTSLRVGELVELFARYYPHALPPGELLDRADLRSARRTLVSALSGGQKQRLYFALAIAGDPDLIFLDEPTVAMDVEARRAFWSQVEEFAALGKTILFSTHHLGEADAVARRIVVIQHGRLLVQGTPAEIKRLVADKTVRFTSDVAARRLTALPFVQGAVRDDRYLMVYTSEPEALLRHLFEDGVAVADLTVRDTDLEAAFVSLTGRAAA